MPNIDKLYFWYNFTKNITDLCKDLRLAEAVVQINSICQFAKKGLTFHI